MSGRRAEADGATRPATGAAPPPEGGRDGLAPGGGAHAMAGLGRAEERCTDAPHGQDHRRDDAAQGHDHPHAAEAHVHDHGHGLAAHGHDHPHTAEAHGHDHGHAPGANGHDHHHGPRPGERGFLPAIALNLGFVALEATAGLLAGSMALLADAGHNLSDVLGLLLAWGAARLAGRPTTPRRTYGFQRATILAALANAMLLLVAVGAIGLESVRRLLEPAPVATGWMLWVALAGVAVNTATALLFLRGRHADLNRRGAFLHMLADAGVSLGVVLGALLIGATGLVWIDPVLGLGIAAVILAGTWGLLREATDLAMDAVPRGIDPRAVQAFLAGRPGVVAVHDLHIWALGTTRVALTAHLERPGVGEPPDPFLAETAAALRQRFGIDHATLQLGAHGPAAPCRPGLPPR